MLVFHLYHLDSWLVESLPQNDYSYKYMWSRVWGVISQSLKLKGRTRTIFPILCCNSNRGSDDSEKGPAGVGGDLILLRTLVSAADSAGYDLVTV